MLDNSDNTDNTYTSFKDFPLVEIWQEKPEIILITDIKQKIVIIQTDNHYISPHSLPPQTLQEILRSNLSQVIHIQIFFRIQVGTQHIHAKTPAVSNPIRFP